MKKFAFIALALLLASCGMQQKTQQETQNQVSQNTWNLQINSNQMTSEVAKEGDVVLVDYVGFFPNGKVFDTSIEKVAKENGIYNAARDYKPLKFTVGAGQMIPCFDKAVEGMKVGETKEITCEPKDAYGECDPNKYQKVPKSQLVQFEKAGYKLEKWTELPTQYGMLKIVDADKDTVTLDLNHPMCGKTLKFKITLRGIEK